MAELADLGVGSYADKEGVNGSTAHGRAMLQTASVFAELERSMIVDRVRAGMARARAEQTAAERAGTVRRDAQGRRKLAISRPRVDGDAEAAMRKLLQAGVGILSAAKQAGVGTSVAQRLAKEMRA